MKIFKYITYLYHYLKISIVAFSSNVILYIFLKPILGINYSAFISELIGTFVLYSLLRFTRKAKIKNKIFGFSLQYFISAITISINIIAINVIYFFYFNYLINQSIFSELDDTYISLLTKFSSSLIGLIFSSTMTIKLGFYFDKKWYAIF